MKSKRIIKNWLIEHNKWSNRNKKIKMKWWNNMLIIYKMSKNYIIVENRFGFIIVIK